MEFGIFVPPGWLVSATQVFDGVLEKVKAFADAVALRQKTMAICPAVRVRAGLVIEENGPEPVSAMKVLLTNVGGAVPPPRQEFVKQTPT